MNENYSMRQTSEFLEENLMVEKCQHDFRSIRSCVMNLIDFYSNVYNIFDETKVVYIIYGDF